MSNSTRSVRKVPNLLLWKNLIDFNEAHLHEATFNLHMHALIFYSLPIVSVDGKHHLGEVVFSALV